MLAELIEILVQLRHFVVRSVEFRELFRITPLVFSRVEAVVDVAQTFGYLGLFLGFPHSINSLPVLFNLHTISSNCCSRENEEKMSQSTRIILKN